MYQKLKHIVFTLIYIILWAGFIFAVWDPKMGGLQPEQGIAVYKDWRVFIDYLYWAQTILLWPIYTVYELLGSPRTDMLPYTFSATLLNNSIKFAELNPGLASLKQALEQPLLRQAFVGVYNWLVVVGVIFYSILNPLIDWLFNQVKNLVWNVLIEFSFTKRKEAKYQEALEKRAADLMKLNVEYKNLSKEASVLATSVITDELTKVYNKRFFLEKIAVEIKRAKDSRSVMSLAMSDIDHFKKLNDTYGHLMGDKVLKAVAQVAKKGTPNDCFCCRFGGEEFAIIMPGKNLDQAQQVISGIHRNLPLLRFEEDPNLRVTSSFGIVNVDFSAPEAAGINTFEDFIKLADDELYKAKLNGRNRIEIVTVPQRNG